jgi:prophage maintenance system killer protein
MISREPEWLDREVLLYLETQQIETHGGLHGIRAEDLLESALGSPRNVFNYGDSETTDLFTPVAA